MFDLNIVWYRDAYDLEITFYIQYYLYYFIYFQDYLSDL